MLLQLLMTRPRDEWRHDVASRYRALEQFSKEDARLQFLRILRSLPYGMPLKQPLVSLHSTHTYISQSKLCAFSVHCSLQAAMLYKGLLFSSPLLWLSSRSYAVQLVEPE